MAKHLVISVVMKGK